MIVRDGRQPVFNNSPRPRAVSISAEAPLIGSSAPITHASWWLPKTIHSSGRVVPGMRATTLWSGRFFQSNDSFMCSCAGPGPT